ncbi:MAG: yknZ 1 [Acidobacteria bacterium]|nr:yknZ 1 [Acidobacteriota bacterium]
MRYLPLLLAGFRRKRLRTFFTVASVLVAFLLFGFLGAVRSAFSMGVEVSGLDRLVMLNKVSLIQPLPLSYRDRITGVQGVTAATHCTWFGGIYQDPKNFFPQIAVEPELYLEMYPEMLIPEAQKIAWIQNRQGALVGRQTAERFGWKVGDRVPIQATVWVKRGGERNWEFVVEGIYDAREKGFDTTQFFFHFDYLNESRQFWRDLVGWYVIRIANPDESAIVARRLDREFTNSRWETKTSSEKVFAQSFANQVGDIGAILRAILSAVFFTLLLVAGNTAAQSVRERTAELALLKTLGFTHLQVLGLVLAESLLLVGTGGALGLALAVAVISRGDPTGGFLSNFYLPAGDVVLGAFLVVALGLASGLLPALAAMRLRIVDALRRT